MNFSIPNLSHFFIYFLLFFPISVNAQTDENQEKDEAGISKNITYPKPFLSQHPFGSWMRRILTKETISMFGT
jgi:hypothetical protein